MKAKLVLTVVICFLSISICQSQILKTLKGHDGDVLCIRFFPNSKLFATGGADDNVIVWDYENFTLKYKLESSLSNILCIAISGDETKLFTSHVPPKITVNTSNNRTFAMWDLIYKKESYPIDIGGTIRGISMTPDGSKVVYAWHDYSYEPASTGYYENVKITFDEYDPKTNKVTEYKSAESSNFYKYSGRETSNDKKPSKSFSSFNLCTRNAINFAGCLYDGYIAAISTKDYKVTKYFVSDKNKFSGDCIAISNDDKYLVAANYGGENWIYVWDIVSGKSVKTLKGHTKDVLSLAISPDNNYIASGSKDETIRLWDKKTGKLIKTLTDHKGNVNCLKFSPDGKYLVSGSDDKNVIIWDALSMLPDLRIYATEYELSIGILKKLQDEKMEQIDLIQSNFSPKGEFETTDAFEQRLKEKNDKIAGVNEFYNAKFEELKANKKQELDVLKERKQSENEVAIQNSRRDTTVKISNVSRYNADKQTYAITIKGMTKNVYIPIDKAPKFKENWKKAKVKCKMELFDDLKNYKYFDFVIIDPLTNEEIIFEDVNEK